jgi:hypothetical protein
VCGGFAPISVAALGLEEFSRVVDGHLTPTVSEVAGGGAIALIACSLLFGRKGKGMSVRSPARIVARPCALELASREQQRYARQSLGMTSAGSSLSFNAFATADSGSEYLATAEHYRYLAKGIVDALHRGCLVLVTGDPPANPSMLAAALREASARRPVIELPCGPDLECAQLFGGGSVFPGTLAPVATAEDVDFSALSSPIYLFADADRLSDDQIEEFFEAGQATLQEPHGFEAGVLLAHSDFVTRAESVEPHFSDEGLAGHLRVQQLERDEVEAFIRRQLPTGEGANLFTPQRVALIAITSDGDPVVVNRLARRMLQTEPDVSARGFRAKLRQAWRRDVRRPSGNRSIPSPDTSAADDEIASSRVTARRYAVPLRLPAGIIVCLGAAWLAAGGALERPYLAAVVGLVREHILPRNEPSEAPAGIGAAPAPATGMGSPSADVAVAPGPPIAAIAVETPPEPVAADGPRLSAAEIAALVARGDAFLAAGDVASARLFFERAADSGDGRAAMRMAVTYDATFLDRAGLRGLGGDPERAAFWFRRARELGDGKAEAPLGRLGTSDSSEPPHQSR